MGLSPSTVSPCIAALQQGQRVTLQRIVPGPLQTPCAKFQVALKTLI
ncbi:hypothetical protein AB691_2043 [Stutzerimonas stutzeri]|nr:hypothetical protein AB691_2043 [Stutzerimonas stutzeri]